MRLSKMIRLSLGSRILAVKVNIWNQELHTHYGITNETPDGFFVPFWDFDEKYSLDDIRDSLQAIQTDKKLGNIYILQTYPKQSYRAFGFDVMDWQYYIATLAYTDYIDWSYLRHSVMRGRAVIRISEKDGTKNMLVDEIISSNPFYWRKSKDHQAFFGKVFNLYVHDPPDRIKVRLSKYESFR